MKICRPDKDNKIWNYLKSDFLFEIYWGLISSPTQEHLIKILFNIFGILNKIKIIWIHQNLKFDSNTDLG